MGLCVNSCGLIPMDLFLWTYSYVRIPMFLILWAYSYDVLFLWWPFHMMAYLDDGLFLWLHNPMMAYSHDGLFRWWPIPLMAFPMIAYSYDGLSVATQHSDWGLSGFMSQKVSKIWWTGHLKIQIHCALILGTRLSKGKQNWWTSHLKIHIVHWCWEQDFYCWLSCHSTL